MVGALIQYTGQKTVSRITPVNTWPGVSIWVGYPLAKSLDTKFINGAKYHGKLILEARLYLSCSNSLGLDYWPR